MIRGMDIFDWHGLLRAQILKSVSSKDRLSLIHD